MKFISTLEECKSKQIKLAVKDNKLLVSDTHGNLTDELKSQLKDHKQEIIAWLSPDSVKQEDINKAPEQPFYPLSYSQQRLWFIDQLEGETTQYHLSYAMRVNGTLNLEALQYALNEIVQRHQVLRTTFAKQDGEPVQVIHENVSVPLAHISVNEVSVNSAGDQALTEIIKKESSRPFDLGNDLMLRCSVLTLNDGSKAILFTMHHIASDGSSMGVFAREFSQYYRAYCDGKALTLDPLPLQFKDFAYWQRKSQAENVLQRDLAYWVEKLAGIPQVHSLPLDKPRPLKQSYDAKRMNRMLDADMYQSLTQLANSHGATLFMVMQAAFAALISRYSAAQDIVIGVPHAGRSQESLKGLIGFFINTLALRTHVAPDMTVVDLITDTKRTVLEAFSHDQLPFEQLIESLNPERTLAYNPVCQIKFVLQNFETASLDIPEVDFTPIDKGGDQVRFDLDLTAKASEKGIYLGWSFKDNLFSEERMQKLAEGYETLLRAMVAQPNAKLSELRLISDQDIEKVLLWGQGSRREANETNRATPLITQFEQQALQTPDAEAVKFIDASGQEISLSYQALNSKADRLAGALSEAGVEAGDHVGVYLTRSAQLLIGLLAIQKLGAAYVVLSSGQETERLAQVISDANIETVLQDRTQGLSALSGVDAIYLDGAATDDNWLSEYADDNGLEDDVDIAMDDVVYVLYTSGSTGKPKGVEVTQAGLIDYCRLSSELHYPGNGSLVASAATFDLTVPGLYVPLINGGSVCLISEDNELADLAAALRNDSLGKRLIRLTPSHIRAVLPLLEGYTGLQSHAFVIGGERFAPALAKDLQKVFPNAHIYNHYGPTETVVGAVCYDVTEHLSRNAVIGNLPIGSPLPNTDVYVLDESGNLAPIGVPGELCIGGKRVAKGYLNQPSLTSEKFFHSELAGGQRLYRTGDKVRWLASGVTHSATGVLDFLGRIDDQVKVRGYRIELGEIEQLLQEHEAVSEAVVKLWGEEENARLVAYAVLKSDIDADALSRFLQTRLPEYMLPSSIELLDAMPLSANGKVNKNALPEPEQRLADQTPPVTETEQTLASIWSHILGRDFVGRYANFFELGGHSLQATRVVSEVSQVFAKTVPVRALFEHRVLSELAAHIDAMAATGVQNIQVESREQPLPLSFAQQRLWFIDQLEGGSPQYNMSTALKLNGSLDFSALQNALNALVQRHEILRTVYKLVDGEPKQIVCAEASVEIEQHDIESFASKENASGSDTEQQDAQLKALVHKQASVVFDLSSDLMVKACLIKLSQLQHVLVFTVHHIASDGWSNAIVSNEFSSLYQSFVAGKDAQLPDLSIQYADYAVWQRKQLGDNGLTQQIDYWKQQLAGIPAVHNLPLDKPRPAHQDFHGGEWVQILDADMSANIGTYCREQGATLFGFTQTLLSVLIARFSGERDIVIGAPTSGRLHKQVEPLIGFFLNTLVMRTTIEDNPGFSELLAQNQRMILDAFSNDTVPFDMLVDELKPQRSLSYHPIVQILLNVFEKTEQEQNPTEFDGLSIEPLFADDKEQLAKADLTLYVRKMGQKLFLKWSYRTSLFEQQSIERLAECFEFLLGQVLNQPTAGVFDLPLLQDQDLEKKYLEKKVPEKKEQDFSSQVEYPASILPQIWRNAEAYPDKVAVADAQQELSYSTLCLQAESLAALLIEKGTQPGDHIAVFMERRCEWLVAALAVLKAGAVYVPIAPEFPDERIAFILQDAQARLVLSEMALVSRLPEQSNALLVDQLNLNSLDAVASIQEWPSVEGKQPSHIIYTSGTTGQPKGVVGNHLSLSNRIHWMLQQFAFNTDASNEVTAVITSPAFIRSVWEMFTPLVAGCKAILIAQSTIKDLQAFSRYLSQQQVTRIVTAPSLARALISLPDSVEQLGTIRYWFLSGEPLKAELANDIRATLANTTVVNLYGSTETMSDVSFYVVDSRIEHSTVPIGKAVTNNVVLVLDEKQRIQPIGVPGEICIAGANLSDGYWQQDALTAEKFITLNHGVFNYGVLNHEALNHGIKLYRTGDLGRLLADGNVECLGRADNQIKIRGFRIELGEIESRLAQCDEVRDAVVMPLGEGDDRYLVAYLVLNGSSHNLDNVRKQLSQWLPDYMTPKQYAVLPEMPLTANGKVNRRALPQIEFQHEQAFVAPTTDTEITVAALWQDILGIERVGAQDNFFEVGGHSLLATRVVNAINEQLNQQVSVRNLFEHPVLSQFAAVIDEKGIDAQGMDNQGNAGANTQYQQIPVVPRSADNQDLPLSFAQQRLWFVDQFEGGGSHYNQSIVLRFKGALNLDAVSAAIAAIANRHDILRTVYIKTAGETKQRILDHVSLQAEHIDVSAVPEDEREKALKQIAKQQMQYPFDLSQEPGLRYAIAKCVDDASNSEYVLFVTLHHIASDGWSKGILSREFVAFYQAFVTNQVPDLPALPIQYADYAHWQRQAHEGQLMQNELAYWNKQLDSLPVTHGLPLDRQRPAIQDFTAGRYSQLINADIVSRLNDLAMSQQASLFMVLQSALAVLIARWSNETDIVIGTPIAGRNRKELEPLIGFFINSLALRNDVSADVSFTEFLQQSRQMVLDAFAHQQTPFDMLVEQLNPERHLSHSPLFQIVLAMQNNATAELEIPGLEVTPYGKEIPSIDVDIHVNISQSEEGLHIRWLYASALFDESTIARFSESFEVLLSSIASAPETSLQHLHILPEQDRKTIEQARGNWATNEDARCAHELFEQWVEQQPDALAAVFEEDSLSYAELNAEANKLAGFLIEQGIKPDSLVAICVERSVEMVIALLGVLKAGGAYLPIDPGYPEERIEEILSSSKVDWVLSQNAVIESIETLSDYNVLPLDADMRELFLQNQDDSNIAKASLGLTADNLAYCIFTSGSTGKPKGVLLNHHGLVNLHENQRRLYDVDNNSRVMTFASISFDGATFEWLWALSHGASLHICNQEQRLSADKLSQFLLDQHITHAAIPPALLVHVPLEPANAQAYDLKVLIVAGEACDTALAWRWAEKYRVCNSYGPSEGTVAATHADIHNQEPIVLGEVLENVVVDVVNVAGEAQPLGVAGELRIGGLGLARGYLDEQLTHEKFRYNKTDGRRYYYTGDLVTRNTKGELEFLGRMDDQVKIRGFRIELGEIEHALTSRSEISKVLVITDESSGVKQLVAYVVLNSEQPDNETSLIRSWRNDLLQSLPDYMVPAAFVIMDKFPLTHNGKVDKRKLPQPEYLVFDEYIAPETATEQSIAQIWSGVLGQEKISANADFFEMGGHSLLATQVIGQIAEILEREVPIRAMFEHSTLQEFAQYVDSLEKVQFGHIPVVEREQMMPLSFSQQRLWFIYQLEGASSQYNMQVALRFSQGFSVDTLQRVLNTLVQRHEILRTTYADMNGRGVQIIHANQAVDINVVDLTSVAPEQASDELQALIRQDMTTAFDLTTDSMLRCTVVHLPDSNSDSNESALILSTHHIASDGWSMNVLSKEFMHLYRAYSANKPAMLPALPIQYVDYAYWQNHTLDGSLMQTELAYWKEKLSGLPTVHGLPLDKPRPARQQFQGEHLVRIIDVKQMAQLHKLANEQNVSLFMLLQSLLNIVYARWSNETDIVIGTPIAGRQHKDLEPLIGFFVNSLVLRNDLSENPSFRDFLNAVKQTTLDAFAHQSLPFEALVEELKPERSLSYSPLYQLSFTFHSHEMSEIELEDIDVTRIGRQAQQARYDLEVHMRENSDGLYVRWVYPTSLFNADTIERIADSFELAMSAFITNPELAVLSADVTPKRDLINIQKWNDNAAAVSPYFVQQLFEQQVSLHGDKLAVVCDGVSLTYNELNQSANQLAHYLINEEEVTPDTIVGVCVDRSVEMIIGLLGVLKAGAAYLPLDPNYPEQRLMDMLEDSEIEIVLTQKDVLEALPFLSDLTVLPLDPEFRQVLFSEHSEDNITPSELGLGYENLAYMVYTSGSTGKPKGVMLAHEGIANLASVQQKNFDIDEHSEVLQFSSFSFDAATWDWLLALTNGASLHISSQETRTSAEDLANYLSDKAITHALIPPAMLSQLPTNRDYAFKVLVVGGEACDPALAWKWASMCRVVNAYGPSESTVVATFTDVKPQQPITLGRGIANTTINVVNESLKQVPVGVPGELLVGGKSLARGYWHRDELTHERFIHIEAVEQELVNSEPGQQRMYRTGDLVRWLPSGELEYMGRNDDQVKIRGFRVELGEVEHRLNQQERVANAVVVVHKSAAQQRLIAYVVPAGVDDVTTIDRAEFVTALRSDIKSVLPDFMVPSAFVVLSHIPMTPNGKVDKNNLPEPEYQADSDYIAPATKAEQRLVDVTAELLDLDAESISVSANFFDLGGHSILAIKLVSMVNQEYGINISVRHLFQHNTLGKLASHIERIYEQQAEHWTPLVTLGSCKGVTDLFCVPAVGLLPVSYQALANAMGDSVSLHVFEPRGLVQGQAPHTRMDEIVPVYLDALLAQTQSDRYVLSGHSFGGAVAFELAIALEKLGKSVELILFDSLIYLPDEVRGKSTATAMIRRLVSSFAEGNGLNEFVHDGKSLNSHSLGNMTDEEFMTFYEALLGSDAIEDSNQKGSNQDTQMLKALLAVINAQFNIYKHYLPRQEFNGSVTLMRAKQGALVDIPKQDIQQHLSFCLTKNVHIVDVSGGHLSMFSSQHVTSMANEMNDLMVKLRDAGLQ